MEVLDQTEALPCHPLLESKDLEECVEDWSTSNAGCTRGMTLDFGGIGVASPGHGSVDRIEG